MDRNHGMAKLGEQSGKFSNDFSYDHPVDPFFFSRSSLSCNSVSALEYNLFLIACRNPTKFIFATGAKDSIYYIPLVWVYPLATNLALYLSRLSLASYCPFLGGSMVILQVLFFSNALISSSITSFQ